MVKDLFLKKEGFPNQLNDLVFSFDWMGEQRHSYPFSFLNYSFDSKDKNKLGSSGERLKRESAPSSRDIGLAGSSENVTMKEQDDSYVSSKHTSASSIGSGIVNDLLSSASPYSMDAKNSSLQMPHDNTNALVPDFLEKQVSEFIRSNSSNAVNNFGPQRSNADIQFVSTLTEILLLVDDVVRQGDSHFYNKRLPNSMSGNVEKDDGEDRMSQHRNVLALTEIPLPEMILTNARK